MTIVGYARVSTTGQTLEVQTEKLAMCERVFKEQRSGVDANRPELKRCLDLRLDDGQKRQLAENLKKAQRDIKESVWRTYKNVMLLGKDGEWKTVDLGLVHSSAAPSVGQLPQDVEISDDVFLIQRELAEAYKAGKTSSAESPVVEPRGRSGSGTTDTSPTKDGKSPTPANIPRLVWSGDVPPQKWMNLYTKVLSKFAATAGLKLSLRVEVAPTEGVSPQN